MLILMDSRVMLLHQSTNKSSNSFLELLHNHNSSYLKIRGVAKEIVNRLLTEQESLLDLVLKIIIEALRISPDKYEVIYNRKYDNDDRVFYSSTTALYSIQYVN